MVIAVLVLLLILVIYGYAADTFGHFLHSLRVTGRMILVLSVVLLVLGLMIYSFVKFGSLF